MTGRERTPWPRRARRLTRAAALPAGALAAYVAALLLSLVTGAAPAAAYWTVSGTGSVAGAAGALIAPAAPTLGSVTATSVALTGTLPANRAGTTYAVQVGGVTVCTPTAASWACTATGLAANTSVSFTVSARLGTSWRATSPAATTTTLCGIPDRLSVSGAADVVAGVGLPITVSALDCNGVLDSSRNDTVTVTATLLGVPLTSVTAPLVAGRATVTVTLFAAGLVTLTAAAPGLTSGSTTATVTSSAAGFLVWDTPTRTVSGTATPLTMTCGALLGSLRTCTQSPAPTAGTATWSSWVSLVDAYGNPATAAGATTVSVTVGLAAPTTVTIPAGASRSTTAFSTSLATAVAGVGATVTASSGLLSSVKVTNAG